jgi:hypothetical protein
MVGEEYLEEEDEDRLEDQAEQQQEIYEDMTPTHKEKDDLYSLFWKVVQTSDSSKVGNLSKTELGMLNISVRDCLRISLLADNLGKQGFSNFFRNQAEIVLATSASKEGWLPELFVSQRKLSTKQKGVIPPQLQQQQPPKKKKLF